MLNTQQTTVQEPAVLPYNLQSPPQYQQFALPMPLPVPPSGPQIPSSGLQASCAGNQYPPTGMQAPPPGDQILPSGAHVSSITLSLQTPTGTKQGAPETPPPSYE